MPFTDTAARKRIRKNLRHWWNECTTQERANGRTWYVEAQAYAQELANEFGCTRARAAQVISAVSPNNVWERNKRDAHAVLRAVRDGVPASEVKCCTYDANKLKAFAIAQGAREIEPKSRKTYSFARNVDALDREHVTVDKWHMRACQTTSKQPKDVRTQVTVNQYDAVAEETRRVAQELGVHGHELQAAVWVAIRERWSR
jgi:hypothetical protein